METYSTQMYHSSGRDQLDNKENVVLRSLAGNSNRHMPLAEHNSSAMISTHEKEPVSMYTLGSRYQPVPPQFSPKKTDPKIYYIDSKSSEEPTTIRYTRETPVLDQQEKRSDIPVVFLQPKVLSQPILYSLVGDKSTPRIDPPISMTREPPSPIIYSIPGRPRTVNMSNNNVEVLTPMPDTSPTLYSWGGNPRLRNDVPEPTKQYLQPAPGVYSIIGSPARTSRGVQASTPDPVQPAPILYTIVGDTPMSTNRPKENRQLPPADTAIYTLDTEANALRTHQPILKPTLYALVAKQTPPSLPENRSKPPARRTTPPPTIVTTRRTSRSQERKPDIITEEIISYPVNKNKYQSKSKEPIVRKSELIVISSHEEERRPRPPISRQPVPSYTNPEQPHRQPNTVVRHPTVQLSDYQSPYTNRTHKPYREQKYNQTLPAITNHYSERKERPPLYEPRYRVERHHPYVSANPISLERYPVNTKPRSSLWDNGYQTQTDDDEDYEQRVSRRNRSYKTTRSRAPWIPVW